VSDGERRGEARVKAINLVDVGEFTHAGLLTRLEIGRTLDLSRGGVRVELSHLIPIGQTITLDLELEDQIVEVHGEVEAVDSRADGRYALGVKFLDLEGPRLDTVEAFLAARE